MAAAGADLYTNEVTVYLALRNTFENVLKLDYNAAIF